jgi:hypothetical protein
MKLTDQQKYDYLKEFNSELDRLVYGYRQDDVHLKYTSLFYKCDGLDQKWIGMVDNTEDEIEIYFDWTNKPEYM